MSKDKNTPTPATPPKPGMVLMRAEDADPQEQWFDKKHAENILKHQEKKGIVGGWAMIDKTQNPGEDNG